MCHVSQGWWILDEYSKDSNDQSVTTTPIPRPSAGPELTLEIKNEKKCIQKL
jgi:hypothetical protein